MLSHLQKTYAAILALFSGTVYVLTLAPSVVAGNSGEYQYIPYILSITHSTGYPLYTLLGKLFTYLPVGSVAYRMNLLSAVAATVAVVVIYFMLRQLIRSQAFAAAATLTFAFAVSFWEAALIAEVHTLNVAFVGQSLFAKDQGPKDHLLRCIAGGLLAVIEDNIPESWRSRAEWFGVPVVRLEALRREPADLVRMLDFRRRGRIQRDVVADIVLEGLPDAGQSTTTVLCGYVVATSHDSSVTWRDRARGRALEAGRGRGRFPGGARRPYRSAQPTTGARHRNQRSRGRQTSLRTRGRPAGILPRRSRRRLVRREPPRVVRVAGGSRPPNR